MEPIVLEGTAPAPKPGQPPYLYLPFVVPESCRRIDVRYEFGREDLRAHVAEPDILDLGLVDPAFGTFPAENGFRGWSGSARRAVFVARDEATPGYLPGALQPGIWHVILGLARVGEEPCPYRIAVEVRLKAGSESEVGAEDIKPGPETAGAGPASVKASTRPGLAFTGAATPVRPTPTKLSPGWYCGDLQSHTHHSDAKGSLADLTNAARSRGLNFLAVTDHNTVSHHRFLSTMSDASLLLVPGMEVTTYRGHANVWGVNGWVDFRVTDDASLRRLVDHVHARGGLFSVNHPKRAPGCIGCDWEFGMVEGIDCVEVWQGPWAFGNWESLERYDRLLSAGRRVTLVGGSDRHQPGWPDTDPLELQVGSPTTWLHLEELSTSSLLEALRRGRANVSEGPEGPRLEIWLDDAVMGAAVEAKDSGHTARARVYGADGDLLRWIGPTGVIREVEIADDDFEDVWQVTSSGTFVRAEVCSLATLTATRHQVEKLGAEHGLPWGLSIADVFSRPYRRALSNPVYLASDGARLRADVHPQVAGAQRNDGARRALRDARPMSTGRS